MPFRRKPRYTHDGMGRPFEGPPRTLPTAGSREWPPTPTTQAVNHEMAEWLDAGEIAVAVVIGNVKDAGVHVVLTTRGLWLANQSFKPIDQISNFMLTKVDRVNGGIIIHAAPNRMTVVVGDDDAADLFAQVATDWIAEWRSALDQ